VPLPSCPQESVAPSVEPCGGHRGQGEVNKGGIGYAGLQETKVRVASRGEVATRHVGFTHAGPRLKSAHGPQTASAVDIERQEDIISRLGTPRLGKRTVVAYPDWAPPGESAHAQVAKGYVAPGQRRLVPLVQTTGNGKLPGRGRHDNWEWPRSTGRWLQNRRMSDGTYSMQEDIVLGPPAARQNGRFCRLGVPTRKDNCWAQVDWALEQKQLDHPGSCAMSVLCRLGQN